MEQNLALMLHLKGKPLVGTLDRPETQETELANAINAARLHGHAQLFSRIRTDSTSPQKKAQYAKDSILRLAITEGEFEVVIKQTAKPRDTDDEGEFRVDIYCKK